MSTDTFHLFAYGTLRTRAQSPGDTLLEACEKVGEGFVRGTLYDTGEFPALLLSGDDRVEGVIWRCPVDLLPRLDRYEGVDERLFRRVGVRVGEHACWTYVAGPRLGERLRPDRRIHTRSSGPNPA